MRTHVLRSGLLQLDGDLADLASELVVPFLVVVRHRRFAVDANIRPLIGREGESLSPFDASIGNLFPIHKDDSLAPLAGTAAVVREFVADGCFSSGNRFGAGDLELF